MVASYTSDLRITKQGDNDNPNSWGDIVNTQVIELLEEAIAGVAQVDITGSSNINIASTVANGATDTARHAVLELTGTLGANIQLILPAVEKIYIIRAAYTGSFTVNIRPSGGSSGIDVLTGAKVLIYTNGTNIHAITREDYLVSSNNLDDVADVTTARTNLGVDYPTLINLLYPVGSLYFNGSSSTNPAVLFGTGTWEAYGAGRVLLGVGTGTDINAVARTFVLGQTGGEYQHTQSITELAVHNHNLVYGLANGPTLNKIFSTASGITTGSEVNTVTDNTGGSSGSTVPMPWLQPYITVHIWRRIS